MSLCMTIDNCIGYTFTYAVAKPSKIKLWQTSMLVYLSVQYYKLRVDCLHVYMHNSEKKVSEDLLYLLEK